MTAMMGGQRVFLALPLPLAMMMKPWLPARSNCLRPGTVRGVAAAAARAGSTAPKPSTALTKNRGAAKKPMVSRLGLYQRLTWPTPSRPHLHCPLASAACHQSDGELGSL